MMTRSLIARLTLLQQVMAVVVVLAFAALALVGAGIEIRREEERSVGAAALRIVADLEDETRELGSERAAALAAAGEGVEPGMRVKIIAPDGTLLAGSPAAGPRAARTPRLLTRQRTVTGTVVEVALMRPWREAELMTLARSLALVALPLLLVSFFVSRWLVRRQLLPLAQMTARASQIAGEQRVGPLGVHSRVLELDQLGEAFDRLLERLDERLLAERRFTADVSHELRTPLTVLSGELELLQSSLGGEVAQQDGLRRISQQVAVMRELVEAMLLLRSTDDEDSAGPAGSEAVDLADVVSAAVADVLSRHPERREDLEVQCALDLVVAGHPVLLIAALRNLLDNACKFTTNGVRVRVSAFARNEEAFLVVEDAGPGITPEETERVFDPFFRGAQARASRPGSGLGLPILRRVARAHGGEVTVARSALGGAGFTLRLPRYGHRPGRSGSVQPADR
jgi:signal transduction histidine kinase